jgi:predicted transcriptional regulator
MYKLHTGDIPMTNKKEIAFTIRVEPDLKDAFVSAAKSQDRTASQLVRDYMRDYVKKHGQRDIFGK